MRTDSTFNIRLATLTAVVAGMLLILSIPIASHAQGKPDVTGQERAAQAQGNADESATTSDDNASSSEEASNAGEGRGPDAAQNKGRGLERAASNAPNETVRARLQTLQTLLAQLRSLFEARFNNYVGEAMSSGEFGDDTDGGNDDGDTASDVSEMSASLIDSTETLDEGSVDTEDDNVGEFELQIEVTASGTDLMIPNTAGTDEATTTGFVLSMRNASDTEAVGTTSATVSSDATETDGSFEVAEGTTETFTIVVNFDPEEAGSYYVQMETINSDAGSEDLTPPEDFQSGALAI